MKFALILKKFEEKTDEGLKNRNFDIESTSKLTYNIQIITKRQDSPSIFDHQQNVWQKSLYKKSYHLIKITQHPI